MTYAVTSPGTEPPRPITSNLVGQGLGSYKVSSSYSRTHAVKFFTDSKWIFSNPSILACSLSQSIAY